MRFILAALVLCAPVAAAAAPMHPVLPRLPVIEPAQPAPSLCEQRCPREA